MKNVIITGAANGVGKEIAKLLKEESLILIDIDEENLIDVAIIQVQNILYVMYQMIIKYQI